MALAHTEGHIRNYFVPPSWHRPTPRPSIRLPSPPPSSTASNTTTTIAESLQTTPPASIPTNSSESDDHDEKQVTFADSPIKMEFEQDFPPLQSPIGTTFRDKFTGSPQKRRASGLDMDLVTALPTDKDEIEVQPAVWPETLTHMMGCGKLAIGIILTVSINR